MDGALAGMDSPVSRPPSPQPAGPVERPVLKLPHPRSPSEKARGPSTGSRDPASNIAPARAPAPDQSNAEDLYDGAARDGWAEDNPNGRVTQAP